jgi:hypothetical protein
MQDIDIDDKRRRAEETKEQRELWLESEVTYLLPPW